MGSSTKNVTQRTALCAAVSHRRLANEHRWPRDKDETLKSPETNPGKIPGLVISYIAIENGDL